MAVPEAPPLVGLTDSHVPPEAAAVYVPVTPLMLSDCEGGEVPPVCQAKVSEVGATVSDGVPAVTFRVTGTLLGLAAEPDAVTVIAPL